MDIKEPNQLLYDKVTAEQDAYRTWLMTQPPAEILHHVYEYAVRQDIVMATAEIDLEFVQAEALCSIPSLLADIYRQFSKIETGYMDIIRECIENRAKEAALCIQ